MIPQYVIASNGNPTGYVPDIEGWQAHLPFVPTPDINRAFVINDKQLAEETADVVNAIASATPGNTTEWQATELS